MRAQVNLEADRGTDGLYYEPGYFRYALFKPFPKSLF